MLATAEPLQERPAVPEPPMLNRPAVPEPPMLNRPLVPEPPIGLPRLLTAEEMDPRPPNISSPIWLVLTERALVQMQQDHARGLLQQRQEQEIRDIRELYEGVSSHEAFARMQMDWARGQVNERWQQQVNAVRTLRQGVPGIDANRIPASMPMMFLRPPTSWTPSTSDILVVTRIWRDVVWVWNESHALPHQGVGQLKTVWLVGEAPHFMPRMDTHVLISTVNYGEDCMIQLQMSSIPPSGWQGGRGIWMLRWLFGM